MRMTLLAAGDGDEEDKRFKSKNDSGGGESGREDLGIEGSEKSGTGGWCELEMSSE